jgi:TonB family protein
LKSENLRRASLSKPVYFESYATVYLVSTRTGRLIFWTLKSFEADTPNLADTQLFVSLNQLSDKLLFEIKKAQVFEIQEPAPPKLEELPEENSSEAKNFKSPLPFKRQVPVYKRLANLYKITATVEATVDLDENGRVTRIEITRWAGYDLDEAVTEVINQMEWRPASRNGKTLPIRVLLRYNFKKIEKE